MSADWRYAIRDLPPVHLISRVDMPRTYDRS